jgi:hypothetical protein
LWSALTWLAFALRLPVGYQHGRYMMPVLPVWIMLGMVGTLAGLRPRSPRLFVRVVSRAAPWVVALLLGGFLVLGARAFADDVAVINCEMVAVAEWLNVHTPADAVVAAHDIGAIGYLVAGSESADRRLVDLAGLASPEVIPFVRDEPQLLAFMLAQQVDYLVTFPSWYPEIVADERLELIYQTHCLRTREQGGDNMAVYAVRTR